MNNNEINNELEDLIKELENQGANNYKQKCEEEDVCLMCQG